MKCCVNSFLNFYIENITEISILVTIWAAAESFIDWMHPSAPMLQRDDKDISIHFYYKVARNYGALGDVHNSWLGVGRIKGSTQF